MTGEGGRGKRGQRGATKWRAELVLARQLHRKKMFCKYSQQLFRGKLPVVGPAPGWSSSCIRGRQWACCVFDRNGGGPAINCHFPASAAGKWGGGGFGGVFLDRFVLNSKMVRASPRSRPGAGRVDEGHGPPRLRPHCTYRYGFTGGVHRLVTRHPHPLETTPPVFYYSTIWSLFSLLEVVTFAAEPVVLRDAVQLGAVDMAAAATAVARQDRVGVDLKAPKSAEPRI